MTPEEINAIANAFAELGSYSLVFGFFTGIFFSHRFIDFMLNIFRIYRLRKKRAKRVSTSDQVK